MDDLVIDDAALEDLLNSPDGLVGQLIAELDEQAAAVARADVPVRKIPGDRRHRAGRGSSARPPGYTKASSVVHGPVVGSRGGLYGGVNAPADPAIFLERPARQMSRRYPFLTTGLDSIQDLLLCPAAGGSASCPETALRGGWGWCPMSRLLGDALRPS